MPLIVASFSATADCANYGMVIGTYVDVKSNNVSYAIAKEKLQANKKAMGASAYKQTLQFLATAYEIIPPNTSAVDASKIAWESCKKQAKGDSPSDLCFGSAYSTGWAATERNRGRSLESLRKEMLTTDTFANLVLDQALALAYTQRNVAPWDLQQRQFLNCKQNLKSLSRE